MKTNLVAAVAAGAVGLGALGVASVAAFAASTPPVDQYDVGTLALSKGGTAATSGSLSDLLTVTGDSALPAGTKAVLYAYVYGTAPSAPAAVASQAPAGSWSGDQLTPATSYSTTPAVTLGATAETLGQFVSGHTLPANGEVELRLHTISAGSTVSDKYESVDIFVSGSTWSTQASSGSSSSTPTSGSSTPTTGSSSPTSGSSSPSTTTTSPAPPAPPAPVVVSAIKAPAKLKSSAKSLTLTLVETGTFTGTVKVYDGSKLIGTATVVNGKVTVKLKKKLKSGKHTIKVVFAGSASASAFSATVKVTVK